MGKMDPGHSDILYVHNYRENEKVKPSGKRDATLKIDNVYGL